MQCEFLWAEYSVTLLSAAGGKDLGLEQGDSKFDYITYLNTVSSHSCALQFLKNITRSLKSSTYHILSPYIVNKGNIPLNLEESNVTKRSCCSVFMSFLEL